MPIVSLRSQASLRTCGQSLMEEDGARCSPTLLCVIIFTPCYNLLRHLLKATAVLGLFVNKLRLCSDTPIFRPFLPPSGFHWGLDSTPDYIFSKDLVNRHLANLLSTGKTRPHILLGPQILIVNPFYPVLVAIPSCF